VRDCERRTLLKVPELAWVAINLEGSVATIEASERALPPQVIDAYAPCNVVAAKSGQVLAMNVFEGQAMVSLRQAVLAGDILISGVTQDKLGKNLFRHARGEVLARVTHSIPLEIPLSQTRYPETGEVAERGYLEVFGLTLPLFLPGKLEGFYRVERPDPVFPLGEGLPVAFRAQRYVMTRPEAYRLAEPEARALALRELAAAEAAQLAGAQILERAVTASLTGESYRVQADYVCIMDICEEREILVGGGTPEAAGDGR
jgi:similar to stage IV sporulation protein